MKQLKNKTVLSVSWHLQNHARIQRKYPDVSVGDFVRVNIKPKHGITKEHHPKWSSEKYKVLRVDGNNYLLNHPTRRKVFLRHELLKV